MHSPSQVLNYATSAANSPTGWRSFLIACRTVAGMGACAVGFVCGLLLAFMGAWGLQTLIAAGPKTSDPVLAAGSILLLTLFAIIAILLAARVSFYGKMFCAGVVSGAALICVTAMRMR